MKTLFWIAACLLAATTFAKAEMSQFWQDVAKETRKLSSAACKGDSAARDTLYELAFEDENPAAMHSWAWMITGPDCAFYTGENPEVSLIYLRAAEFNYPPSLMVTGFRFFQGYHAEKDVERGLTFITRAVNEGYAIGAIHAANAYIDGKHVAQDLDEAEYWLIRARDGGVGQDRIDKVEARLAALRPKSSEKPIDLLSLMEQFDIDPDKVAEQAAKEMADDYYGDLTEDTFSWDPVAKVSLERLGREQGFDAKQVKLIVTGYVDGGPERCSEVDWVRSPEPGKLCFDLICPGRSQVLSFDTAYFNVSGPAPSCKW